MNSFDNGMGEVMSEKMREEKEKEEYWCYETDADVDGYEGHQQQYTYDPTRPEGERFRFDRAYLDIHEALQEAYYDCTDEVDECVYLEVKEHGAPDYVLKELGALKEKHAEAEAKRVNDRKLIHYDRVVREAQHAEEYARSMQEAMEWWRMIATARVKALTAAGLDDPAASDEENALKEVLS